MMRCKLNHESSDWKHETLGELILQRTMELSMPMPDPSLLLRSKRRQCCAVVRAVLPALDCLWTFSGCPIELRRNVVLPFTIAVFFSALILAEPPRSYAQTGTDSKPPLDTFLYAPANTQSSDIWTERVAEKLEGKIEELDDQRIVYVEGEKRRELPSNRVTHVEPVWRTAAATSAHKLFSDRKYREAKDAITKAATNDLPRWQQRFLVAQFVDVLDALGDTRLAGGVYLKSLAPNQPPNMLYAQLPLSWTTAEPNRGLYEVAIEWLEQPSESAQLLGASWLLLGSESGTARAKLLKLQSSKVEPIAALAVAQAWRIVPPPETEAKLSEWLEYRDRLIQPLQLGPTEFIAERLARVGKIDQAIGQWSRIATFHADRPHHAALALDSAQRLLTQQGRANEAKRLQTWAEQFVLE